MNVIAKMKSGLGLRPRENRRFIGLIESIIVQYLGIEIFDIPFLPLEPMNVGLTYIYKSLVSSLNI